MKTISTFLALLVLIFFTSCHRYYTSASFAVKSAKHKTIAVLPPQLVITGTVPRNISGDGIREIEEKESRIFQESLYNNLLRRANTGKYAMNVSIQPYTNTLAALEKNNVSIRDSWTKDDKELAGLLGVDAVVRTSIQKERFISDLASAGIVAGRRILDAALKQPVLLPGITNKTNDIRATCTVLSNGEALWNDSYKKECDFNSPASQVIEKITDNFAKHFPYRKKV